MKRPESRDLPGLFALFFCSGFAAVGCQIVWSKTFGAGIGLEYPATLAVVTAFMCGLGVGGFVFERLPERLQSARTAYAWLQLIIAVWGIVIALGAHPFSVAVLRALGPTPSPFRHWSTVFTAILVMLLPATSAMGATLPAVERVLSRGRARSWTGALYATNTAGAMFGAFAAAFFLMPALGLSNSLFVFAGLSGLCGLLAFAFAKGGTAESPTVKKRAAVAEPNLAARLFFAGLFGIGFETLLIRSLSHVLESTVYTFAVVLAVYLLGAAVGSALQQRSAGFTPRNLFIGLAVSCALSAIFFRWLAAFYLRVRLGFGDSLLAVSAAEFSAALVVFIVPAFFMGATFAALAEASLKARRTLGWSVGWNSFGSALAPPVFGFVAVPLLGLKFAFAAIVLGYAALAGRAALWLVPTCAVLVPFLCGSTEMISHPDQKIVFLREGPAGSVAVLESTNQSRVLKVNNRFQMGGTAARIAEERHADIPLLLHAHPRRALFIGLGTGITFNTAANYPQLEADAVELLPGVIEAMPLFQENPEPAANDRLHVHVADGRRFILTTTNQYDVIVGDLFHPAQDGAAFLYTQEHFAAVRGRLNPNGLFCQWLPLYQMDLGTVDLIAHTFRTVFSYAEVWLLRFNVDTPAIGLIGWTEPPRFSASIDVQSATLRDHLRTVALGDALRLYGCRLGELRDSGVTELNTDDHPIVLFRAPQITFRQHDDPAARLVALLDRYSGPLRLPVDNPAFVSQVAEYRGARDVFLRGLVEEDRGNLKGALDNYIESARVSAEFTSGYARALGIATTLARSNPTAATEILERLTQAQPERPVARQLLEKLRTR